MKCPKCSSECSEDAEYCGLCYEPIKKTLERARVAEQDEYASPELTAAMAKVCEVDTPGTRARLYHELLGAILVVPKIDRPALGRMTPAPGENPTFPFVEFKHGLSGLAAFTGVKALLAWRPGGCAYVLMKGQGLFLMGSVLKAQAVAINPGNSPAGLLLAWEVTRLAEGVNPSSRLAEIKGSIEWQPIRETLPGSFLAAMTALLAAQPEVQSAYAVMASINGAPKRLVILVSTPAAAPLERLNVFMPALVKAGEAAGYDAYFLIAEECAWFQEQRDKVPSFYVRKA